MYCINDSRKPKSERIFDEFLDMYPKSCSNFPVFYTKEELEFLKGSKFIEKVRQKVLKIESDYKLLSEVLPDFGENYSYDEFSRAMMLTSSRIFGFHIGK